MDTAAMNPSTAIAGHQRAVDVPTDDARPSTLLPLSSLEALPFEILSTILILACFGSPGCKAPAKAIPDIAARALHQSRISPLIRGVALSTPILWTHICEAMSPATVDMFLNRSGRLPLTVRMWERTLEVHIPDTLPKLFGCAERWETVYIEVQGNLRLVVIQPLLLPRLRELHMDGTAYSHPLTEIFSMWTMPSLLLVNWHAPVPSTPFPSTLVTLHYRHLEANGHSKDFYLSLSNLPSLRYLYIHCRMFESRSSVEFGADIVLPQLQFLQISAKGWYAGYSGEGPFFQALLKLQAPRLCQMNLIGRNASYLYDVLQHFDHGGVFHNIHVGMCAWDKQPDRNAVCHFPQLVSALPSVRHLVISRFKFENLLSFEEAIKRVPTHLETITIEDSYVEAIVLQKLMQEMRTWDIWETLSKISLARSVCKDWGICADDVLRLADGKLSFDGNQLI